MAGGIVATNNGATIDEVEVNNVNITSTNSNAGGIIACTSNKITNATVKEFNSYSKHFSRWYCCNIL